MNVSDIITEFGAYYLNSGQNKKDLSRAIYHRSRFISELFTRVNHDSDIYRASASALSSTLQPFQNAFTPSGELAFTPNEIKLQPVEMELKEENATAVYKIKTDETRKLLGLIPIKVKKTLTVDAEDTEVEIIEEKSPWWSFLTTR